MIDELVTGLVEREQAVLRELVRLAELNTAQALAEPAFHTASMSIRAQLRAHAAKVEELELLASEQDRASDVEQAMRHVSRHRSEGATLQASLRDLGGKVTRHAHAHVNMFMHMHMPSWCTLSAPSLNMPCTGPRRSRAAGSGRAVGAASGHAFASRRRRRRRRGLEQAVRPRGDAEGARCDELAPPHATADDLGAAARRHDASVARRADEDHQGHAARAD